MRLKWLVPFSLLVLLASGGCRMIEVDHGAIPVTTNIPVTVAPDAVHPEITVNLDTAEIAKVVNGGIKDIAYVAIAVIALAGLLICWYIHTKCEQRVKEFKDREFKDRSQNGRLQ